MREQGRLRVDNHRDLRETIVNQDGDPRNVGQKVILPATFCGGPRYMFERQQDAMVYFRKFGRSDLFIKVTTNPNWTNIFGKNLNPGQQLHDHLDLLVRVFVGKSKTFLKILKVGCFGCLEALLYNIEFQKRGLPRAYNSQNPSFMSITFYHYISVHYPKTRAKSGTPASIKCTL